VLLKLTVKYCGGKYNIKYLTKFSSFQPSLIFKKYIKALLETYWPTQGKGTVIFLELILFYMQRVKIHSQIVTPVLHRDLTAAPLHFSECIPIPKKNTNYIPHPPQRNKDKVGTSSWFFLMSLNYQQQTPSKWISLSNLKDLVLSLTDVHHHHVIIIIFSFDFLIKHFDID
jgi:hypothetical protein